TGVVGYLPEVQELIMQALGRAMPEPAMKLVRETLADVVAGRSGSLLSFGVLGSIWAASSGVSALISTLNRTLETKELRPFWKVRLVAILLTVALSLMVVGGAVLIMFGDKFSLLLTSALGFGRTFALISRIAQYALGVAGLVIGIDLIRYFGPA